MHSNGAANFLSVELTHELKMLSLDSLVFLIASPLCSPRLSIVKPFLRFSA
jgi:hypothetical protein